MLPASEQLLRELEAIHAAKMTPHAKLHAQLMAILNEYIRDTEPPRKKRKP